MTADSREFTEKIRKALEDIERAIAEHEVCEIADKYAGVRMKNVYFGMTVNKDGSRSLRWER
jgi:hypothetical protein